MRTLHSYRSVHEKIKEFYRFFPEHVEAGMRRSATQLIEEALKAEVELVVDAEPYERTARRRGSRNGYYMRQLITQYGLLSLRIPRIRDRKVRFQTILRYRRYSGEIEELIRGLFFGGVSTRKVGVVLEYLLDTRVSPQTVSRITQKLDREVKIFHTRALGDDYQYLFLDGIVQSERATDGAMRGPLLVAYGITHDGRREVIDYIKAKSESEAAWEGFLEDLYRRGLTGKRLKLIVADGAGGLWRALERVYPRVPAQLCWAHKMRNIQEKLPRRAWDTCLSEAKQIYRQDTRREATERYFQWVKKYRRKYPKAVRCLEKDIDRLLVFYSFPHLQRVTLRTTNPIERLFREVRRRTSPIGSFTNTKSLDRITYGIFWIINRHWEDKHLAHFTQNS
jgi:transposase-like protein